MHNHIPITKNSFRRDPQESAHSAPLRIAAKWGISLLSLVLILGCNRVPMSSPQSQSSASEGSTPPSVRVVKPERSSIHREVSQPGAIEAFEETPVFAKVSGYVKKWHVDIGDSVREGQVLAELSVPELEVELEQKESLIRLAEEQVEQARKVALVEEAAVKSAEAKIRETEAGREQAAAERKRAQSQYERLVRAGQGGVIEKESIEENRLSHEAAEAGLKQAEARVQTARALRDERRVQLDKARADVRVAEANRAVAGKNRDYVKEQLRYTRLPAPYAGVVTRRSINTGDFVQSVTTGKGKPLYVVERTDLLRIFVQVPETDADWVRKGAEARIRVQALRGQTFTGRVARTSWSLDPATRTLRAEIDLPNAQGPLRPGMYASASLTADLADVLTLPRSAVAMEGDVTRGYQTFCFQVEDGKVRRLPIELGPGDSERVEVLRKQVRAGGPWVPFTGTEEIVRSNLSQVRDGQTVRVKSNGDS